MPLLIYSKRNISKNYYYNNKDALENTSPVLNTNDHPLWGDEYLGK